MQASDGLYRLREPGGLYYSNARWFDPAVGRFISLDPIRDGNNWFLYVRNNPLRFLDPTGLQTRGCCGDVPEPGQSLEDFARNFGRLRADTYLLVDALAEPAREAADFAAELIEYDGGQAELEELGQAAAELIDPIDNVRDVLTVAERADRLLETIRGGTDEALEKIEDATIRASAVATTNPIAAFVAGIGMGLAESKTNEPVPTVGSMQQIGHAIGRIVGALF